MEKNQKGSDDVFDVENSLWKSNFCTLRQGGKDRKHPGMLIIREDG